MKSRLLLIGSMFMILNPALPGLKRVIKTIYKSINDITIQTSLDKDICSKQNNLD